MDPSSLRQLALELLQDETPDPARRWDELMAGLWSVVDEFEHGGRRYFVAIGAPQPVETELSQLDRSLLAERAFGASVKQLASSRGVSEATISRHLRRAMRRLGLSGQAQLARIFASATCE